MMPSGSVGVNIPTLGGLSGDEQLFASTAPSASDVRGKRGHSVEEDDMGESKRLRLAAQLDGEQAVESLAAIREELTYIRSTLDALKNQLGGLTNDMGDIKKQNDRQKWLELKDVKTRLQQGLKERLVEKSFFVDDLKQDVKVR